jgi:hypothetical protein
MSGVRFKLMPVFSDAIAPDAEMAALIEKWRKPYEADLAASSATRSRCSTAAAISTAPSTT